MNSSLEAIEFLVSSKHRVGVLEALRGSTRTRRELREATGASSPTLGRVLNDLEERHWITRSGAEYQLTDLGTFVGDRFATFREDMGLAGSLRAVWPWLPHDIDDFSIDQCDDMVISRPGPGYPYRPIERFSDLLSASSRMRGFGMVVLKSSNLEPFFDQALDGLECEYIYPPDVFDELLAWDGKTVREATSQGNYTVWLHDDLPLTDRCGICLFDNRVSICCYDHETGSLEALVDTGSEEIQRWAESYFVRFRAEARSIDDDSPPVLDRTSR